MLAVSILNNGGNGFSALSFNQSGGYVPPDTCGAAGPSAYVETVNQSVGLYGNKSTGANAVTDSLSHFFFSTGGLTRADSGSGLSDPIVAYDEKIQRFIIGDQDVDFTTHVSSFDLAVSKTNSPTSLSASDWSFYKINTTQTNEDADYPGNFGYNADAFVFTLNMFAVGGTSGTYHTQVVSVNAADLASAVASPRTFANNVNDFSLRPTTMHDSVAGDPMWFVTEHGDNLSIDIYKMTNVLSSTASFAATNVPVMAYSQAVAPLNPNGTAITTNIDSRILKSAEANNTIVTTHTVSTSSTQDVAQWYAFDVSTGTPKLSQQGRVGAGSNTYVTYPGIDINAAGAMGMSFIRSGTDSTTDYESMWVAGRVSTDATGTMETATLVPNGKGLANYTDFASTHRQGDLSGINVDPVDGSFWAANEFANTQATANWGTAVANFNPAVPTNSADVAVTVTGPSSVTAGTNATYTVTVTNNGPNPATGVVLTDSLPAGSIFDSMTLTTGTDAFTLTQSGGTATETASSNLASGSTDTFTLVVSAPSTLAAGSNFSNSATVTSTSTDSNTANNTATATGQIVGAPADLAVTNSGPTTANEGDLLTYTVTVTNTSTTNLGTGVVLQDTLGANLSYVSATASQGSFSQSSGVVTFSVGSLAPGASATLTLTAKAMEDGTLTNSATVTATSSDPVTSNNTAAANTTAAEPSIVVSAPITTTLKSTGTITTATFTHAGGIEPTSAFKATINWGDGKTSSGTISLSGTTYKVTGSHKYSTTGTHTITTTVTEIGAAAQLLLTKVGDEVPAPLDRFPGNGNDNGGRDANQAANEFAQLVNNYAFQGANGPNGSGVGSSVAVTLKDLRANLNSQLSQNMNGHAAAAVSTLTGSLRNQSSSNQNFLDVLQTIDDVFANYDD